VSAATLAPMSAPGPMHRPKGGDGALPPFQVVLDAHGPAVHRYLVACVGRQDADDRFQETVIAALRAYPNLRHSENLEGWMVTIAHRKVIDGARATARRPVPLDELPERGSAAPSGPDPELWDRVRALPPKQRSAVVLRHVAGWRYVDIAEVLETSEGAARQNVLEALKRLRTEIDEEGRR
jgi:RNA polymerase sigma factor (sigma-70 family)